MASSIQTRVSSVYSYIVPYLPLLGARLEPSQGLGTQTRYFSIISSLMSFKNSSRSKLVLVGLGVSISLYFAYSAVAQMSKTLVYLWFLYETGSSAKTAESGRKKLAFALLFLAAERLFESPYFLVPRFVTNLVRIPVLLLFNIFGETILDFLMQTQRWKRVLVQTISRGSESSSPRSQESSPRSQEELDATPRINLCDEETNMVELEDTPIDEGEQELRKRAPPEENNSPKSYDE